MRQGRGDRYSRTTSWDAEGWCNLGMLCTIYVKVTLLCVLAADCITLSSARHDLLLPEESHFLSWQQVLKLPNLPAAEARACLKRVCTICLSRPELCSLASVHLCLLAGRALVWIVVQVFPLIHRRDLFSHLLHRQTLRVFEAVKTCCPSFCSTSCRVLEIFFSC